MEEYEQIQEIIEGRKHKAPHKNHNPEFKLSNIMECAECGGRLVGFEHRNGKKSNWIGYKYRCRGCNKKMYRRADVHDALSELITGTRLVGEDRDRFITDLKEVWKEGQSETFGHIQALEVEKSLLDDEKKRYLQALASYPELKDEYISQINQVTEKIKIKDEEITAAKKIDDDLLEFADFALDYIDDLKNKWWELDFTEMQKCKQILYPSGFSINYLGRVYTPEISPLFRLEGYEKEPFRGSNLGMVEVAGVTPASSAHRTTILHAQKRIVTDEL